MSDKDREFDVELSVLGSIGDNDTEDTTSFASFAEWYSDVAPEASINCVINSPGGSVFEGLSIYQALSEHTGTVRCTIRGIAASISSIIPMAADEIVMGESSRLMIHNPMGPSQVSFGDSRILRESAEETAKTADLLDSIKKTLVGIYEARSSCTAEALSEWMDAEKWLDAEEAHECGLVDTISPNKAKATAIAAKADYVPAAIRMSTEEMSKVADLCRKIAPPVDTAGEDALRTRKARQKAIETDLD